MRGGGFKVQVAHLEVPLIKNGLDGRRAGEEKRERGRGRAERAREGEGEGERGRGRRGRESAVTIRLQRDVPWISVRKVVSQVAKDPLRILCSSRQVPGLPRQPWQTGF